MKLDARRSAWRAQDLGAAEWAAPFFGLPVVNIETDKPTVHHPPPTGVGIQDVPAAPLLTIGSVGLNHDFDLLLAGLSNR